MITIALLFVDVERGRLILGVAYRVEMSKHTHSSEAPGAAAVC